MGTGVTGMRTELASLLAGAGIEGSNGGPCGGLIVSDAVAKSEGPPVPNPLAAVEHVQQVLRGGERHAAHLAGGDQSREGRENIPAGGSSH
eukprot:108639-Pyramimonas_sp.AAC.1